MLARPVTTCLVLLLLAGCASPPEAPAPEATAPETEEPTLEVEAAPEVVTPSVAHCRITRTAANTEYGFGLNADSVLYDEVQYCEFSQANASFAPFQSALVEVAWGTFQSSETEMHLRLDSRLCGTMVPTPTMQCDQGSAVGTSSPLRLELDAETLVANEGQDMTAYAWATGASLQHDLDIYITLFPDAEVPADYTAVE